MYGITRFEWDWLALQNKIDPDRLYDAHEQKMRRDGYIRRIERLIDDLVPQTQLNHELLNPFAFETAYDLASRGDPGWSKIFDNVQSARLAALRLALARLCGDVQSKQAKQPKPTPPALVVNPRKVTIGGRT